MRFDRGGAEAAALAEDLVNTFAPVHGFERLPDRSSLSRFLRGHGLTPPAPVTDQDLTDVHALRPRLRLAFEEPSRAVAVLNQLLAESGAAPYFTDHDGPGWHLHVAPPDAPPARVLGADAALGLLTVIGNGGLSRLRVCEGKGCVLVFIDMSRNRSRRYCSPAVCGNRTHAATFRTRQRQQGG